MKRALLFLQVLGVTLAAQGVPLPSASPQPSVAPLEPPVSVLPYPLWMLVSAGVVALLLLIAILWGIIAYIRRRPAPPPPTPQEVALRELDTLEAKVETLEPYALSIEASHLLRRFITDSRQLAATAQTTPEFLAAVAGDERFSEQERELLARFLEKADLIKFARLQASHTDSSELLTQAHHFVTGEEEERA